MKFKTFFSGSRQLEEPFDLFDNSHVDYDALRVESARWDNDEIPKGKGRYWLERVVLHPALEITVFFCIAVDLVITIITLAVDDAIGEILAIYSITAVLMTVLLIDVTLRVSYFKIKFFRRLMNWFEMLIAVGGVTFVILDGVNRMGGDAASNSGGRQATIARAIRPVMRGFRVVRTIVFIASTRGGVTKILDRHADRFTSRLIRLHLQDALLMPASNLKVSPSNGKLHLEKVQIRSSAFEDFHLPFTIDSGICEMVHVEIELYPKRKKAGRMVSFDAQGCLVVVENVMLVLKPGHHQEFPNEPWSFEECVTMTDNVVNLLTKRAEARAKRTSNAERPGQGLRRTTGGRKANMTRFIRRLLEIAVDRILSCGMHVSVRKIEVRYEDSMGELTGNAKGVIAGAIVGSVQLRLVAADKKSEQGPGFRATGHWKSKDERKSIFNERELDFFDQQERQTATLLRSGTGLVAGGVRFRAECDRICAFWDIFDTSEAVRAHSYGPRLREGSGHPTAKVLAELNKSRRREQLALAICNYVEVRLIPLLGKTIARERARRLCDRAAAHQYILMPCSFSVHSVIRLSQIDSPAKQDKRPLHRDIDIECQELAWYLDVEQLGSIAHLAKYVKRWDADNKRLHWTPPPGASAEMFWGFALERVLHSIDPNGNWMSLFHVNSRRRAALRVQLLDALTGDLVCTQWEISTLQTLMPLSEVLFTRKEAVLIKVTRRRGEGQKRKHRRNPCRTCIRRLKGAVDVYRESEGDAVTILAESSGTTLGGEVSATYTSQVSQGSSMTHVSQGSKSVVTPAKARLGEKNSTIVGLQVRVRVQLCLVELVRSSLLNDYKRHLSRQRRRRVLVKLKANGFFVAAAQGAPQSIWRYMAPPGAVLSELGSETLPDYAVEACVDHINAVFCAAPSTAPRLRRFWACSSDLWDYYDAARPPGAGGRRDPRGSYADRAATAKSFATGSKASIHRVGFQPQIAYMDSRSLTSARLPPSSVALQLRAARIRGGRPASIEYPHAQFRWKIEICMQPTSACLFKPMILEMKRVIDHGGFFENEHPASATPLREVADLGLRKHMEDVAQLRKRYKKKRNKLILDEKLMGLAGPMRKAQLHIRILLVGGFRGEIIEAGTQNRWLSASIAMPCGQLELVRDRRSQYGFDCGFHPTAGTPVNLRNGWWFPTKEDADLYKYVLCFDEMPSAMSEQQDLSCAGGDALEVDVVGAPMTSASAIYPLIDLSVDKRLLFTYKLRDSCEGRAMEALEKHLGKVTVDSARRIVGDAFKWCPSPSLPEDVATIVASAVYGQGQREEKLTTLPASTKSASVLTPFVVKELVREANATHSVESPEVFVGLEMCSGRQIGLPTPEEMKEKHIWYETKEIALGKTLTMPAGPSTSVRSDPPTTNPVGSGRGSRSRKMFR